MGFIPCKTKVFEGGLGGSLLDLLGIGGILAFSGMFDRDTVRKFELPASQKK